MHTPSPTRASKMHTPYSGLENALPPPHSGLTSYGFLFMLYIKIYTRSKDFKSSLGYTKSDLTLYTSVPTTEAQDITCSCTYFLYSLF